MVEAKLFREDGLLMVAPVDKLTQADFDQIRNLVNPFIEDQGHIKGVLIDAETFSGWEGFAGALSHFRLINEYEKEVERVAAVTDNTFLAVLPQFANYFINAEVRHFKYVDRNQALDWLYTGV